MCNKDSILNSMSPCATFHIHIAYILCPAMEIRTPKDSQIADYDIQMQHTTFSRVFIALHSMTYEGCSKSLFMWTKKQNRQDLHSN